MELVVFWLCVLLFWSTFSLEYYKEESKFEQKNCTVCYIFGIMWTFDIIMICVVEVLSYNSWIKRKYEIFTFLIMTFVQPHWNVLHAIGFSFLLRISGGHIHKKMSFWWTMYARPTAPINYAPVYMCEDFYIHSIDFILSWIRS